MALQSVGELLDMLYPEKKQTLFQVIKKKDFTPSQKRLLHFIDGFPNIEIPYDLHEAAKELFKMGIISKKDFYFIFEKKLREWEFDK